MIAAVQLFTIATALSPASPGTCEMMTIPQLIERMRPNPVYRNLTAEIYEIPFRTTAAKAELVVEGVVRPLRTYLNEDECWLYTEFEITVPQAISGKLPLRGSPGAARSVVVKQLGGSMTIDGVKVFVVDQQLPPFQEGQRVLLLLSRPASGGPYEIVNGAFGAFVFESGDTVRPVLRIEGIYDDMQRLSKAQFVERSKLPDSADLALR